MKNIRHALLLVGVFTATCDDADDGDTTPPTVTATVPADGADMVDVGAPLTAVFSEAMDPATIGASTFTLRETGGAAVNGAVSYDAGTRTATFTPSARLDWNTDYTATVTTGVTDEAGNAMAADHVWTFLSYPPPPGP
ncbi:MAG: Ig-like domain-containing protein [Deltaproteobacteria bacterium]|nr:Ig-like domain-containing protein [Deltaproteobacteria bacterium]